ncbi:hypothetical protein AB0926_30780 [Streptomyces griseoincarnatus]
MSLRTAADLERVVFAERWRRIRRMVVVEVLVMGVVRGMPASVAVRLCVIVLVRVG